MRICKLKSLAIILAVVMTVQIFPVMSFASSGIVEESGVSVFVPVYKSGSYGEYLQNYMKTAVADKPIEIDVTQFEDIKGDAEVKSVEGRSNVVVTTELSEIKYTVNVDKTGMYSIGVDYYPVSGKGAAIERGILIDGEYLFTEARSTSLDRIYVDDVDDPTDHENYFIQDESGNQLRPVQTEAPKWVDGAFFKDSSGAYDGALQFYFEKGEHTITFSSVREPVAVSGLRLFGASTYTDYDDAMSEYAYLDQSGTDLIAQVECEYPSAKSEATLFAGTDRASPSTSPASSGTIKMNMLGSTAGTSTWKTPGQWVEYTVDVPEEGMYKLAIRARQNAASGAFSSREITVNNELPYEQAAAVRIGYNSNWQMVQPKDEYNNDLLFHFNQGENTIRLKAVLGDMADIINAVEAVILKLNADYRRIIMITGQSPDQYRDYDFDEEIPETISDLKAQADILKKIHDELVNILGERGEQTATLETVFDQLYTMYEDPDKIPKEFSGFKNNIGNLGSWLLTAREQPLEIDYILVADKDYKVPKAETNFFAGIAHQVVMFFSSFFTDVNAISATSSDTYDQSVTVWMAGVTSARDYAQVVRQLVDRSFIPDTGINVDLELVPSGALLPSTLAGKGPDVAMNQDAETVMNYAARNALQELDIFEDFDEVTEAFLDSAIVPTTLDWGNGDIRHYGLPETQTFLVMFYRQDILEEYNLSIPNSWDEVYDIIAKLQKRYMDFAPPAFETLLYQNGGQLYNDAGKSCALDTEVAIDSFIQWTDLYTSYKLPVESNFANRFRFAEMPMGMQTYDFYNQISVFAPEIKGLWSFGLVPGTIKEDGSIDRSVIATAVSSVMMAAAEDKEAAWEYMKWWTGTEAQVEYGREIESILGTAARYTTANTEALQRMPWRADELAVLMEQREYVVGYPQVPGSYALTRNLNFAFLSVVNDATDPRETLLDYTKPINDELRYKRAELGFEVD